MDNYIIDRDVLAQVVDELMKQKPLSANSAEEVNNIREKAIGDLDEKICTTIFDSLPKEKLIEFNQLLDRDETTEEDYQKFFEGTGVDLQTVISEAATSFKDEFLGGGNE